MVESNTGASASGGTVAEALAEITRRNLKLPNQLQYRAQLTEADVEGLQALGNSPACNDWLYRLCIKMLEERRDILKENREWRDKVSELTVQLILSAVVADRQNYRVGF